MNNPARNRGRYAHGWHMDEYILVGGFNHLEKYESMGRIIPYILEKNMFQTTNQYSICMYLWVDPVDPHF